MGMMKVVVPGTEVYHRSSGLYGVVEHIEWNQRTGLIQWVRLSDETLLEVHGPIEHHNSAFDL